MSRTRMWIVESDNKGSLTNRKFSMDDPLHIPRIGEFVDSDEAGGWVNHVQYNYNPDPLAVFCLVVYVYLGETK
jgi:hypothetical protein